MGRRAGLALVAASLALALVAGSAAKDTSPAVARPAVVSLDLRTHRQHLYPLHDLAGLCPDGKRIVLVTSSGGSGSDYQLRVRQLDGSHDRVLLRTASPVFLGDPRWSPDGRTIAYSRFDTTCASGLPACHGAEQLWLVPVVGGAPRLLSDDAGTAAWASDSRRIAFPGELEGAGWSRLTVQDEDGSGRLMFGARTYIYSLSWSADGRRVLYSTNSPWFAERGPGEIHAVVVATGADSVVAAGVDPALSRDGKFLSFMSRKGNRTTLFLQRHGKRRVVLSRPNFGFVHAWSRTGHVLAFAAMNRYGQDRIFVFDPDRAKPLRAVTRWAYGPVQSIAWSRDGRRLLFARTAG